MKKGKKDKKKKLKFRRILKKQPRAEVRIPQGPTEGVWDDPNRFFKRELNQEKENFFFG